MLCDRLERLGFRVVSAYDENDARRALATLVGRLDVAVIDVRLPGSSGLDLMPVISEYWPRAKVIYISGKELDPYEVRELRNAIFLGKPFHVQELLDAIEQTEGSPEAESTDAADPQTLSARLTQ